MSDAPPITGNIPAHAQGARLPRTAGLGILWALFVLTAQVGGVFEHWDQPFLDWRQAVPAPVEPTETRFALIEINDIPEDQPWPWPRLNYALLLNELLPYQPQSVVLAVPFPGRDTRYPTFDRSFARVVDRFGADRLIFSATALRTDIDSPALEGVPRLSGYRPTYLPRYFDLRWPLEAFSKEAPVGLGNVLPETNGQPRTVTLLFNYRGKMLPSLSLQSAARLLRADLSQSSVRPGPSIVLRDSEGEILREIPIDEEGRLHLRFRPNNPPPWRAEFSNVLVYSYQEREGEDTKRDLADIHLRQVFVGRTDERPYAPIGAGPGTWFGLPAVAPAMAAVEVHFLATRAILDGDFIIYPPEWVIAVVFLLIALVVAVLFVRVVPWLGVASAIVMTSLWWALAIWLFVTANLELPMVSVAILAAGSCFAGWAAREWDTVGPLRRPGQPRKPELLRREPLDRFPSNDGEPLPDQVRTAITDR